jgi:hypothetical protein
MRYLVTVAVLAVLSSTAAADDCTRELAVTAADRDGRPLSGLDPRNFRIRINGERIAAERVEYKQRPYRLLILLDRGPAMLNPASRWNSALAFIGRLLKAPEGMRLGLLVFDRVEIGRVSFDGSRDDFERLLAQDADVKSLRKLERPKRPKGMYPGSIFEPFQTALEVFGQAEPGDTLLVVTAAEWERYTPKQGEQIRTEARKRGLRVFAVTFTTSFDKDLRTLASDTGGVNLLIRPAPGGMFNIDDQTYFERVDTTGLGTVNIRSRNLSIQERVNSFVEEVTGGFYWIQLRPSASEDRLKLKIDVLDDRGKLKWDVYVRHLQEAQPCGESGE